MQPPPPSPGGTVHCFVVHLEFHLSCLLNFSKVVIQRSGKESERIGVRPYFYLKYVASGLPFNFDNPSIIDNTILSSLDLLDETLISSCQEIQKRVIYASKKSDEISSGNRFEDKNSITRRVPVYK